jgi:hypothetical protein
MPIQLTADGALDPDSFRHSTDEERRDWLVARLRGADTVVPGGTVVDEDRHLAIAVLYDKLDRDDQRSLRRMVIRCLADAVAEGAAQWADSGKIELIRLVELVVRDSVDEALAVRQLTQLLSHHDITNEVKRKALQALVGIGFTLTEGFWLNQYCDPSFGPVVLEGLGTHSAVTAFRFLRSINWTPAIEAAVAILVPDWVERFGPTRVRDAFEREEASLEPQCRNQVRSILGMEQAETLQLFKDPRGTFAPIGTISHSLTC